MSTVANLEKEGVDIAERRRRNGKMGVGISKERVQNSEIGIESAGVD